MFKEVADIKTSDQLHLPVPEAKFETVVAKPSDLQKEMVQELSKRAARIHSGTVDASEDNMLCVTNDGRKIGLDVRLMNPMLPDDPNSKLNVCVQNVLKIWEEGKDRRCASFARKYGENGSRDQRAIPACGGASLGRWLEAQ